MFAFALPFFKRENKFFALAFGIAAISSILHLTCCDWLSNDVASLYAPIVREIGEQNWSRAFYHLCPPLVPILAGGLASFGLSPLLALQTVSSFFFVAGLWPLRALMRYVLPEEQANWTCLLYVLTPRLMRYAGTGMLDSAKTFWLLLAVWILFRYAETFKKRYLAAMALALAALSLSRGEGVLFLPLFGVWCVILLILKHRQLAWKEFSLRLLTHGLIFATIFLLACLPQLLYIHSQTGYYALDSRQAYMLEKKLAHGDPAKFSANNYYAPGNATSLQRKEITNRYDKLKAKRDLLETLKGLNPLFLLLALMGLWVLVSRKRFSLYDAVFLSLISYNILIFWATGFISKRYIVPTVPFELGWAAVALTLVPVGRQGVRRAGTALLVLAVGISWFDGSKKLLDSLRKPNPEREVGEWIYRHRRELASTEAVRLHSSFVPIAYHNGRAPVIMATSPQCAYWSQGDYVCLKRKYVYSYEQFLAEARAKHVILVVADDKFQATCPEFAGNWQKDFQELDVAFPNGIKLYRTRRQD
jgi:4-amino-4-deoxy-L-arabinose transferase-like glycosyltransferase